MLRPFVTRTRAEFRIGRHLTPLPVVRHVGGLPFGMREGHRLPALVQLKRHHDRPPFFAVGMQVRHEGRSAFHRNQPDAPWRALAEVHVGRDVQRRFGQKRAAPRRVREDEIGGQARRTRIARRIAERPARPQTLQHEAAFGGGPRETVRGAAARARRRRRQPRPLQRIFRRGLTIGSIMSLVPRGSPRPRRGRDHS